MVAHLLFVSGCGTVEIKDQEWCVDQGTLGAHCAHTLSTPTRDIPEPDWDNLRFGQACTIDPQNNLGATLAEMKKELEELCSISNACTYEKVTALRNFLDHMIKTQEHLKSSK